MPPIDRKRATDYPPEVLELFDGYVHNALSRRDFLDRATKYAIGGVTALAMLETLQPNFAWAEQVKATDKRIKVGYVEYASAKGSGKMRGYLARPAKAGKLPGVVVIHENRGLNPYIEDVARRTALAATSRSRPTRDARRWLSRRRGQGARAVGKLDAAKRSEDMVAAAEYLEARDDTKKIGAVGFCYGGGVCCLLASRLPWLAAAVPFYGSAGTADDVKTVKAALQVHLAETDERVNASWPDYETALKANKVRYEVHRYAGTQHGFHNDTTPRFDDKAAKLAWSRTLAFFKKHLR